LATVAAEPEADAAALNRLAEWCGRYSPWTAPDGADGIKIEITGCAHLWDGEAALAADLARRLARQDIAHRIAVAGGLGAAWALAAPADLARAAERLADDLVRRLAREGMGARRLDLAFHRIDGRVEHIRLGTARPSRDPKHLAGLFAARLETIDPGLGVEDMIL